MRCTCRAAVENKRKPAAANWVFRATTSSRLRAKQIRDTVFSLKALTTQSLSFNVLRAFCSRPGSRWQGLPLLLSPGANGPAQPGSAAPEPSGRFEGKRRRQRSARRPWWRARASPCSQNGCGPACAAARPCAGRGAALRQPGPAARWGLELGLGLGVLWGAAIKLKGGACRSCTAACVVLRDLIAC